MAPFLSNFLSKSLAASFEIAPEVLAEAPEKEGAGGGGMPGGGMPGGGMPGMM